MGGARIEDLSQVDRKRIFEHNFVVRLLPEMPDEEVRAIFKRANKNTVTLNAQELRHGTYWRPFIKLMEEISDFEFWNNSGILSANESRRMLDVEFVSELAVAVLKGLQNKKKRLEEFYQQYETKFEEQEKLGSILVLVLGEIEQLIPKPREDTVEERSPTSTLYLSCSPNILVSCRCRRTSEISPVPYSRSSLTP